MQYRKLLRALHDLRTEVLEPAPGLLTEILGHLEEAGERRAVRSLLTGRRVAYLGGHRRGHRRRARPAPSCSPPESRRAGCRWPADDRGTPVPLDEPAGGAC